MGFYQILFSLSTTLRIKWPPLTLSFLIKLRFLSLNLPSMPFFGCVMASSFLNSFIATMLLPPIIIAAMLVLRLFGHMEDLEVG